MKWIPQLGLVWVVLAAVALASGCGSPQSDYLAYRLTPGQAYYYQYYEWLDMRPGAQAPAGGPTPMSLEIFYDVTVSVAEAGRQEVRIDVTVENARARVIDAVGGGDWHVSGPQVATLYLRPGTGEVIRRTGQMSLNLPGTTVNPLHSFRQSLQQYPDRPARPGAQWSSQVHAQIAREVGLSDAFEALVTYTDDDQRSRESVAHLTIEGNGGLRDGSGSLTMHADAYVSRLTGMPVEERTQMRMESAAGIFEGRSSLTQTRR